MRGAGRLVRFAFALAAVAAVALAAASSLAAPVITVTAAAVWRPPAGFVERFHKECDGRSGAAFDGCFAAAMAKAGASPAALDFTRLLDNQVYLQAYDETGGPVSVAHVVYPFRANENDAWFLVNGTPPLIDVDNRRNLKLAAMRSSPAYLAIYHTYRNVTFWPGDRGAVGPQVMQNGREFVIGYLLRNLCHACAIVGRVRYAFDFAADGTFLGTRLVSVTPTEK